MLGPRDSSRILAQLPLRGLDAESKMACSFDNKIGQSESRSYNPDRARRPIRWRHDSELVVAADGNERFEFLRG